MVKHTLDAWRKQRRTAVVLWLALAFAWSLPHAAQAATGIARQSIKQLFPEDKSTPKQKAPGPGGDEPVTLEADSMGYDADNHIVVAVGHVVVVQGGYLLNADKLTYYQDRDVTVATGNVSVLQPTGDIFFADNAELRDHMNKGVVQQFKLRLADDSVMAAKSAHKISPAVTKMNEAVYSPCKICEDMAPFWQLKAAHINVDEETQDMVYHDVQMEMFGVPAFYSPYLSGPTPKSDAKSGLLTPTYSSGANLGSNVKMPYYWRIADDKDAVIMPWFFTNDNPMLDINYHQLTDHGSYTVQASGIEAQKFDAGGNEIPGNEFRGNIAAIGEEEIADYSRVGFDINRVTDQTYLRRYDLPGTDQAVLFSTVYAETAEQRDYASIKALAIQGLRTTDDSKTTPQVWPTIDGYYETIPLDNGMNFHFSGNAQNLSREIGANQRRLTGSAGVSYPYVTDDGQVLTATANFRQDYYDEDHVTLPDGTNFTGTKERSIPQGAVQWRMPFVRPSESGSTTLEPIFLAVTAPTGNNSPFIDNEDSRLLELNDTNLFDIDRTPGYDVVDSGSRVAYGFRSEYLFRTGESIDALIGQNYSVGASSPFPGSTNQGRNASDVIGRVGFTVAPFTVTYRFAVNQVDERFDRNSLNFDFNKPWLDWNLAYNSVKNNSYVPNSEEVSSKITFPVSESWKLYAGAVRDLQLDQMTNTGVGAIFHNECFDFTLDGMRNYTHDVDVSSGTSVTFRLGFKNLGVWGG